MATIKAFKNLQEIEKNLNQGTKFALQNTLIELVEEFRNIIKEDVYNVYQPAWYERSWWLLEPKVIKYYIKVVSHVIQILKPHFYYLIHF